MIIRTLVLELPNFDHEFAMTIDVLRSQLGQSYSRTSVRDCN